MATANMPWPTLSNQDGRSAAFATRAASVLGDDGNSRPTFAVHNYTQRHLGSESKRMVPYVCLHRLTG